MRALRLCVGELAGLVEFVGRLTVEADVGARNGSLTEPGGAWGEGEQERDLGDEALEPDAEVRGFVVDMMEENFDGDGGMTVLEEEGVENWVNKSRGGVDVAGANEKRLLRSSAGYGCGLLQDAVPSLSQRS